MIQLTSFSTILQNGDTLGKVNSFLSRIRASEIKKFEVQRISGTAVTLLLEVQFGERFSIVASSPEDGVFLQEGRAWDFVDVLFSEPVEVSSLIGTVYWDGNPVTIDSMALSCNNYKLRITAEDPAWCGVGDHKLEFRTLTSENYDTLVGKKVLFWTVCRSGGSKGGRQPTEPERRTLMLERISVEEMALPQEMLHKFLNERNVRPQDIVDTRLIGSTAEYERTELFVLYMADEPPAKAIFFAPQNGACMYWNTSEPLSVLVSVTYDYTIDTSALMTSIYFDDLPVDTSKISFHEENFVVEVETEPADYGHHWLEIFYPSTGLVQRPDQTLTTYVLHTDCCTSETDGLPPPEDPWLEWDVLVLGPGGEVPPETRAISGVTAPKRRFLSQVGSGGVPQQPAYVELETDDIPFHNVGSIQSSNYTATIGELVRIDPSGGTFDVTLPPAGPTPGKIVTVKNSTSDVTAVTIKCFGAQTIDGSTTANLAGAYASITVVSDGNNWLTI